MYQRSYALAKLPFKVKTPKELNEFSLLVAPEFTSGTELRLINVKPADKPRVYVRLSKEGSAAETPPLDQGSYTRNVELVKFYDLYSPGEYVLEMFEEKDSKTPVFSTGFRVLPNPKDESISPYLEVYYAELEFGSYVHFDYQAKGEWSDKAFIGLVLASTPKDAVSSYAAAKGHTLNLNHRRAGVFDNISTEGLPAGKYELRMYDNQDESGRLQAVVSVELKSEEETLKKTEEIEQILDELVATTAVTRAEPELISTRVRPITTAWQYDRHLEFKNDEQPVYRLISEYSAQERARLLPKLSWRKAAFEDACNTALDRKIIEDARIAYTLGRDNTLEQELKSFGKSILTEWAVPNGLEKVQTGFKIAFDAVEHGTAGLNAMSEKDYSAAAKEAALFMIKTTLNACSDSDCFLGIVSSSEDAAAAYFGQLSDAEFADFMRKQAQRVRTVNSDGKFANSLKNIYAPAKARMQHMTNMGIAELTQNSLDKLVGIGSAAADSEADEGADAFISLDNGVIKTNSKGAVTLAIAEAILRTNPKCAAVISSARVAYQTMLEARDFVRDSSVISAYSNWQKFNETDADWLIKAGGVRGLGKIGRPQLLDQVRNIMIKTLNSNAMTRSSLSDEHKTLIKNRRRACEMYGSNSEQCTSLKLTEADLTEEEIWSYLKHQFEEWDKLEKQNSDYAEFSKEMLKEYKDLDAQCRRDLQDYYRTHLQKKEGAGDSLYNALTFNTDKCKEQKEMFEAFLNLRSRLESAYKQIMPPQGRSCAFKNTRTMREYARENLCSALHWNKDDQKKMEQQLMSLVADDACRCGVSMSVVDGKLYTVGNEPADRLKEISEQARQQLLAEQQKQANKAKHLERISNYEDPYKIGVVMQHIGKKSVLNCLCMRGPGHPAFGGGSFYTGSGKCHSCGVTGHCWYSGMSNKTEDKKACGYFDELNSYVQKQSSDESLKPMMTQQEIKAQLIDNDEFLELRKPNQCKTN